MTKVQTTEKKGYVAPKLTTHGDVAKLTQHLTFPIGPIAPGSNLFPR